MDTASFNTIVNIQKEEMQKILKAKTTTPDVELGCQKREWALFFVQAKKLSKNKRKINSVKTVKTKLGNRKGH